MSFAFSGTNPSYTASALETSPPNLNITMWAGVPSEPLCLHTQSLATAQQFFHQDLTLPSSVQFDAIFAPPKYHYSRSKFVQPHTLLLGLPRNLLDHSYFYNTTLTSKIILLDTISFMILLGWFQINLPKLS
eukprot:TRINITY_DN8724_c0_g1_i3.p1 TRINITY_DN8724_c0_g1~~TRINITY_DN8724_c0_g1_i3.p1  ORF type:complete len:132 (+),score=6.31 TRINITY_DN8724_c0_g1_i3:288-683(+)